MNDAAEVLTRDALIERLEKATEGSRELDALIWIAIMTPLPGRTPVLGQPGRVHCPDYEAPERSGIKDVPDYTFSIDTALTLVPEGWGYFIRKDEDGFNAALLYPNALRVTPGCGQGANAALSICIAALRASSSTESERS